MKIVSSCCTAGLAGAALLTLVSVPTRAEVVDSGPSGFAIERNVRIAAAPARVYIALTKPAKWWNSEHTFSGSAANMTLEARAGGCFCEIWNGGSVQHLVVVEAIPGKTLRMRGALGPFQGQGMDGALTFTLKQSGSGTDLTLDNILGGFMKSGIGKWPALADAMLAEQMARLKLYIETGSPEAPHK